MNAVPEGLTKTQRALLAGKVIGVSSRHVQQLLDAMESPNKPRRPRTKKLTVEQAQQQLAKLREDVDRERRLSSRAALLTARHEAAHAVVAREFGLPCVAIEMDRNGTNGSAYVAAEGQARSVIAAVGIAGAMAQVELEGLPRSSWRTRWSDADRQWMRNNDLRPRDREIGEQIASRILDQRRTEIEQLTDQLLREGCVEFETN